MGDARETEKDPDAFRTISEVADDLHLPQHVLRFWETRFPQIKPVKRAGGRRFYRPEDVDLLRGIQQLLYREGYTIKGVQKILKEQGIRHVQDLGVERDVAVMRSAAKPERPAVTQDGAVFGGLLGLLPRRRNKGYDDPELDKIPRDVELPLPFPDAEADRDLAVDYGEPVAPLPPRTRTHERRLAERRYDEDAYEERIYEERDVTSEGHWGREPSLRDEPNLGEDVEPLRERARRQEPDWPEERSAPSRHVAAPSPAKGRPVAPQGRRPDTADFDDSETASSALPSFAPQQAPRPEPVPQRRPTRGPAARVSTAPVEEFDDPLLPFMDQEVSAPAPLDERIRRLKEQEAGPPEEYLPRRLRSRAGASADDEVEMDARRPAPVGRARVPDTSAPAAPRAATSWPELARAEAAAEHDLAVWHHQIRAPEPDAAPEHPRQDWREGEEYGAPAFDDDERAGADDAPMDNAPMNDAPMNAEEDWYAPASDDRAVADEELPSNWDRDDEAAWHHSSAKWSRPARGEQWEEAPSDSVGFHVCAPVSARLGMGSLVSATGLAGTVRFAPSGSYEAPTPTQASAPKQRAPVRQAPPQQRGPQRMPSASALSSVRSAAAPTEAPVRRVGPLTGPLEDDLPPSGPDDTDSARPAPSSMAGRGPWEHAAHGAEPQDRFAGDAQGPVPLASAASKAAFWRGRDPFDAAAPEPVDSYLPPHLRKEPQRPSTQGGVQPVLSKDDVHRLQAALYELGECRRLLGEAAEPKAETGQG